MSVKVCFIENFNLGSHSDKFEWLKNKEIMEKYGVIIVDKMKGSDIVIAGAMDCEIEHTKRKVILCERYDACTIGSSYHYYSHPNVIAVFKDYMPRDKSILTECLLKKRYHYNILNKIFSTGFEEDTPQSGLEEYIHKFKQVSWFSNYTHLDINKHMKFCAEKRGSYAKTIDIFCVYNIHDEPINTQRAAITKILNEMESTTIVAGSGFGQTEYHESMMKSKIVVAPWGIGERIAADQKAILCNCVLVKPDTDYVLTYPDLYQDKYYVKCKHDLSDLKEICVDILNNYEKYLTRTNDAFALITETTKEKYIEQFCIAIKESRK